MKETNLKCVVQLQSGATSVKIMNVVQSSILFAIKTGLKQFFPRLFLEKYLDFADQ